MITLDDLRAEKDRLAKQENNAIAVLHQVRGAMMQTDALIAKAEKKTADEATTVGAVEAALEPANGNQPNPPEAA